MEKTDKIGIVGYGVEGKAILQYLTKHGYTSITVCDADENTICAADPHVSHLFGVDYLKNLNDFDVVFRSPGVKSSTPEIVAFRHMCVTSDGTKQLTSVTQFFLEQCPCPVIGVTGTKGKGTTSTLIYKMLKADGRNVYLGGNIGEPPVNFLDQLTPDSLVVLELSSFQLQDMTRSPHIAVVLNVTAEHMDYHENLDEYVLAKEAIVRYQQEGDFGFFNIDYDVSKRYSNLCPGEKFFVSRHDKVAAFAHVRGDGMILCHGQEICLSREAGLLGEHNLENILPACAVAEQLGVSKDVYTDVVKKFRGLPHRLELVRDVDGVRFYNDSFSTTPETSVAGVLAFDGAPDGAPVYLLAGGSEKNSVFDEWAATMSVLPNVRRIYFVGAVGKRMHDLFVRAEHDAGRDGKRGVMVDAMKDGFDQAVVEAMTEPMGRDFRTGEPLRAVVLMSPGCASFNEFQNYKHRGESFREWGRGVK